jgi:transcriptional regulator with XRE-family HTH domain
MNIIRNTRLKKKITQKQLADLIGVSQAYISKIESNEFVNVTIIEIIKLSKALSIDEIEISKYFLNKYNNGGQL